MLKIPPSMIRIHGDPTHLSVVMPWFCRLAFVPLPSSLICFAALGISGQSSRLRHEILIEKVVTIRRDVMLRFLFFYLLSPSRELAGIWEPGPTSQILIIVICVNFGRVRRCVERPGRRANPTRSSDLSVRNVNISISSFLYQHMRRVFRY